MAKRKSLDKLYLRLPKIEKMIKEEKSDIMVLEK